MKKNEKDMSMSVTRVNTQAKQAEEEPSNLPEKELEQQYIAIPNLATGKLDSAMVVCKYRISQVVIVESRLRLHWKPV